MKNNYETTTHKLNLTGGQISIILYVLEGYVAGNFGNYSDITFKDDVDNIFAELQSLTDNYYAQLDGH